MNPIIFDLLKTYYEEIERCPASDREIIVLKNMKNRFLERYVDMIRQVCTLSGHEYKIKHDDLLSRIEKAEIVLIEVIKELIEAIKEKPNAH